MLGLLVKVVSFARQF